MRGRVFGAGGALGGAATRWRRVGLGSRCSMWVLQGWARALAEERPGGLCVGARGVSVGYTVFLWGASARRGPARGRARRERPPLERLPRPVAAGNPPRALQTPPCRRVWFSALTPLKVGPPCPVDSCATRLGFVDSCAADKKRRGDF
jgi:hypothetical protein